MPVTSLQACKVVPVALSDVLYLRHRVLVPRLSPDEARFDGDNDANTQHFGAYIDQFMLPISCATFILNGCDDQPALQLRGMATEAGYRSRGFGRELLRGAETHLRGDVRYDHIQKMWCNAREAAASFYRDQGWKIVSDLFDIPHAGLHYRMVKDF